jgi:hypothetical protein
VDFPEELKLPIQPDQYQTVSLEFLGIDGVIAVLKEQ